MSTAKPSVAVLSFWTAMSIVGAVTAPAFDAGANVRANLDPSTFSKPQIEPSIASDPSSARQLVVGFEAFEGDPAGGPVAANTETIFRDKDYIAVDHGAASAFVGEQTKGAGSRTKGLLMAYKLLDMAQARWRRLDGAHLLPLVRDGVAFVDGVQKVSKHNEPRARAA